MNQHQRVMGEIARQYESFSSAVIVTPSALAHRALEAFCSGNEDPHIQWASLEHFKQMSREFLRRTKDVEGEDNDAHAAQGEMFGGRFSGALQDRYPLPRKQGDEPSYKLRLHLTPEERAWNVRMLRRSAEARMEHADALEAEGQMTLASGAA